MCEGGAVCDMCCVCVIRVWSGLLWLLSSTLAAGEDTSLLQDWKDVWLFRFFLNVLGYCTIIIPGYFLIGYFKRLNYLETGVWASFCYLVWWIVIHLDSGADTGWCVSLFSPSIRSWHLLSCRKGMCVWEWIQSRLVGRCVHSIQEWGRLGVLYQTGHQAGLLCSWTTGGVPEQSITWIVIRLQHFLCFCKALQWN